MELRKKTKALLPFALALAVLILALVALGFRPAVSQAKGLLGTTVSANISTDTTWTVAGSPYTLTTDITILPGATLTIQPGVSVKGQDWWDDLIVQGHLNAVGTASQPITFTSVSDSAPNQWGGIDFNSGSSGHLHHATVRYANTNIYATNVLSHEILIENSQVLSAHYDGISVSNSRVRIDNSLIAHNSNINSNYSGLFAQNNQSVLTLTNVTFLNNGGYGLFSRYNAAVSMSGSSFDGQGNYPLTTDASNLPQALHNNTFANNTPNRLRTNGTLNGTTVFSAANGLSGYELNGNLTVPPGATLTVAPGTVVMSNYWGHNLIVQGHLDAVGTASQPITFTSVSDSASNQWGGLDFNSGSSGHLRYATVRYANTNIYATNVLSHELLIENSQVLSAYYDGISVSNSRVRIDNSLIANNSNYNNNYSGLFAQNNQSVLTLTNVTFLNNGGYGLVSRYNAAVSMTGSSFDGHGNYPLSTDASNLSGALHGNTFANNIPNRLRTNGTLNGTTVFSATNGLSGYELNGNLTVPPGATLTVAPGATVMGSNYWGHNLIIQGHLDAVGTASQPITFTSVSDSASNQWGGLDFNSGSSGHLRYATVRYANTNIYAANVLSHELLIENSQVLSAYYDGISVSNSRVRIDNSLIANNSNYNNNYSGLFAQNNQSVLTLTNVTFLNNGGYGLVSRYNAAVSMTGSSFDGHGNYPLTTDASNLPGALHGNTFANNTPNRLRTNGTLNGTTVFSAANGLSGYELNGNLTVPPGATLTVAPGTAVMGSNYWGHNLIVQGHLDAVGTASQPITFTSVSDSASNQWGGLDFNGGSGHLRYVTVRYANDNIYATNILTGQLLIEHSDILSSSNQGLSIWYNSRVTVDNSRLAYNGDSTNDYALYAYGTGVVLTVTNSVFENNAGYGLYAGYGTQLHVANSAFNNNGNYPLRTNAETLSQVLNNGNSFSNNAANYVTTAGVLDGDVVLGPSVGLTEYRLDGNLTVPPTVTLTIEPGTTVKSSSSIFVQGHLDAVGAPSHPIIFTSLTDDAAGQWWGLDFIGGTGHLRYATVRYGYDNIDITDVLTGQVLIEHSRILTSYWQAMDIYNSNVTIADTRLENSGTYTNAYAIYLRGPNGAVNISNSCVRNNVGNGIRVDWSPSLSISTSDISGNFRNALQNTSGVTVTAQYNWWGHPSGPTHAGNPGGTGLLVSDNVDYSNWLSEPTCGSYLRLSKSAPDSVIAGDPVTYTLKVSNQSAITATNLVITDALPSGANFMQALDGGQLIGGQTVSWTIPSLLPYSNQTVRFVVNGNKLLTNKNYRVRTGDGVTARGIIPIETTIVSGGTGVFAGSGQDFGIANSQAMVLGDINGDGYPDTFVANGSPNEVWLNNGNGSFTQDQLLGDETSQAIALGDLDGDGVVDALVGNNGSSEIWLNNGSGTFGSGGSANSTLSSGNTQAVALGDLDGDGTLDAFIGNDSGSQVWFNNGSGSLDLDTGQSLGSANSQAAALADFDGDGDLDAVVTTAGGQNNQVWLNDGSGTFSGGATLGTENSQAVAIGDLDDDDQPDIVLANSNGQPDQIWLNDGSGSFNQVIAFGNSSSQAVALGDLDADGDLDIFIGTAAGEPNLVWINQSSGVFTTSGQLLDVSDSTAVVLGDLDGDGDLDTFVANAGSGVDAANQVLLNLNQQQNTIGTSGGTLVNVNQGLTTTVDVPAGAVDQPTAFNFTPLPGISTPAAANFRFANRAFRLEARQGGSDVPHPFVGGEAFTMTIDYNPAGFNEDNLVVHYLDETAGVWVDVVKTCSPESVYRRDTTTHEIAVRVCHLTEFGLFESIIDTLPPIMGTPPITGSLLITPSLGVKLTNLRPRFEWAAADDPSGLGGYNLWLTSSSDGVTLQGSSSVITTTTPVYTPTVDLLPGAVYTWTVRAFDTVKNYSAYVDPPQTFEIEASRDHVYIPLIIKAP